MKAEWKYFIDSIETDPSTHSAQSLAQAFLKSTQKLLPQKWQVLVSNPSVAEQALKTAQSESQSKNRKQILHLRMFNGAATLVGGAQAAKDIWSIFMDVEDLPDKPGIWEAAMLSNYFTKSSSKLKINLPAVWGLTENPDKLKDLNKKYPNFCKLLVAYKGQFSKSSASFAISSITCNSEAGTFLAQTNQGVLKLQIYDDSIRFYSDSFPETYLKYKVALDGKILPEALVIEKPIAQNYYPHIYSKAGQYMYLQQKEACDLVLKTSFEKEKSVKKDQRTLDCLFAKSNYLASLVSDQISRDCSIPSQQNQKVYGTSAGSVSPPARATEQKEPKKQ